MKTPELHCIRTYFSELSINGDFRPIIGNDELCVTAALLFPLRGVPTVIRGEAGSAKTTIVKGVVKLAWGDEALNDEIPRIILMAGSSEKGMLSGDFVRRVNDTATHCVIPELEFVVGKEHIEDIVKLWLEGSKYVYSRASEFGKETEKIVLNPLPIITSLANENKRVPEMGEELERRFVPFYTESSRDMNARVHLSKAEMEALPNNLIYKGGQANLDALREHFEDCNTWRYDGIDDVLIKNPCAPYMQRGIPKRFTMSNTYINYWHENVKAVTQWYYGERHVAYDDDVRRLMCTPADNWVAWALMGKTIVYASLRLKDMGNVLMSAVPTSSISDDEMNISRDAASFSEIYDKVCNAGYNRSRNQIKALLMQLVMAGYVRLTEETHPRFWKSREYSDEMDVAIDWTECNDFAKKWTREYYPNEADDYIHRYCEDPVAIHPVTGATVKLLDIRDKMEEKETKVTKKKISKDALDRFLQETDE